jgi:hypothetical protein
MTAGYGCRGTSSNPRRKRLLGLDEGEDVGVDALVAAPTGDVE